MVGAMTSALLLALCCATATPQGRIVVRGAASGSTLQLSVQGSQLVVRGWMSTQRPAGCSSVRGRSLAACDLRDVGGVEVVMGPNGDFVEVEDKLPVPLLVRLGGGSDKFVGNGEPDTCYSEGARRNRCVGGPGDDVCITGNRNSDCVGGPGDDYCKHGAGSDGCWGGPGEDVCIMGAGEDGCHGGPGNDRLYGGANADQLYGGEGRDYCDGRPGWGKSHGCEVGPRR